MERQKIMEELQKLAGYRCNDAVRLAFLTEEEAAKLQYGTLPVEEDPQIQAAIAAVKAEKAT